MWNKVLYNNLKGEKARAIVEYYFALLNRSLCK